MTAFAVRATPSTIATQASRQALKPATLLAPGIVNVFAAYKYKDVIFDGCTKILGAGKPSSSRPVVFCRPNFPSLPELSLSTATQSPNRHLHSYSSKGKKFSQLSAASASLFGDQDGLSYGIPRLPVRRRSSDLPKAYKNDFFRFPFPVLAEKPEWWWRTLACLPYLIALQISDAGYFIRSFLEHYDYLEDLIFFVPGAVSRLPTWFTMVYCYIAYIGIVKNREWPHFFRFHLMMGMLLETAMQLIWYTSNFFPLIHYNGTYGMYYWAGVGLAYILVLLQCVSCALLGGYAHIPVISDAALIHTLFNIGGFQRPF
ncbi:protein TIC 20-IV, chloroplastic [Manihot esculenta]|uniref:Protein TIC 20 n=1 Tax=Manihot esculenta TaxID=3983 RepID=A0A2C9V5T4_MANES|nr:protein TIC 20-IV, chloroplastic [Manihot esculenta]XP_021626504.1 protein TIC 20-IV, chloroplastic [Manihot esculenta]XP_021626505.1 protein TIC 20-IV, chloroplastic [Manihot esculenta]XP_021626507.1 protein TIC 20-IV, chloroplastic [Manihot esculenta]XP_043816938.1 protein TIC 20-IV, chloroplastic [Manihot esculenta]XP_043816939.1 protein TIC 20-IV, chloroplastic [Manihot esculenta]OAY39025.1 hypothetical protein MANES_10G061600v8 [Manihot esculenta]